MASGEPLLPTIGRLTLLPNSSQARLSHRKFGDVTKYRDFMNREQTDRYMKNAICSSCALRRLSAAFATSPTAKLLSIAFHYNLSEISPKSTLTHPHPKKPIIPIYFHC